MCTVTLLRRPHGYRLVCNRDESRSRRPDLPPLQTFAGDRRCVWPVDPAGGGTWIGVNDAGLAVTLLNLNPPVQPPVPQEVVSRGTITPRLLSAGGLSRLHDHLRAMRLQCFAPFQLLATDGRRSLVARWDQVALRCRTGPLVDCILLLTSSGLGDHVVAVRRATLLRQCMTGVYSPEQGQDLFHHHAWPDQRHVSVLMSRHDARTVSRTTIDVGPNGIQLHYAPIEETTNGLVAICPETHQLTGAARRYDASTLSRPAIGVRTCA